MNTMSRLKPGTSKASSAPPWYSAPNSSAGQHDAQRVVAPDQRHRDAGEAGAADEVEQQPVVHAGDLVHAHQPGQRAGDGHRQQHLALAGEMPA